MSNFRFPLVIFCIYRLTAELANVEGYQDAYSQLYEQVGLLIARNQLAEEEAERISKFNAQILGHNNPAQRIMYVDRIRTELAEAKMVSTSVLSEPSIDDRFIREENSRNGS